MVSHEKEVPEFVYDLETERQALLATKAHRNIPEKSNGKLLAATWNLTNFGVQKRTGDDLALIWLQFRRSQIRWSICEY